MDVRLVLGSVLSGMVILIGAGSPLPAADQDVILNEVLANALDEDKGEFIELFNRGQQAVDVGGWALGDRADSNDTVVDYSGTYDWGLNGTVIPAGGYAIVVDPEYDGAYQGFLQEYADSTRILILTVSPDTHLGNGLTNGHDRIFLTDQTGHQTLFSWSSDPGNGISWEKIDPLKDNAETNWAPSTHPLGSTPGARNSVTPPLFNAAISPSGLSFHPPQPTAGDTIHLLAWLYNRGQQPLTALQVTFYLDRNGDDLGEPDEALGAPLLISQTLAAGDSTAVSCSWTGARPGRHRFLVQLTHPDDQQPDDNQSAATLMVSFPKRAVIINEIVYAPLAEEPEWVELQNQSEAPIDLNGWTIEDADSTRPRRLATETALLPPQGFIIITADSTRFREVFPDSNLLVLTPQGRWPALNNSGDWIRLRDFTGKIIDAVNYEAAWGGGRGTSLERILPEGPSQDSNNWGVSRDPSGYTAGRPNSRLPLAVDLAVVAGGLTFSPPTPTFGSSVTITVQIYNAGRQTLSDASVTLFEDRNGNRISDQTESIVPPKTLAVSLAPLDTAAVRFTWEKVEEGLHLLGALASHPADLNSTNDTSYASLAVAYPPALLIFSEFMYAPRRDGTEWIELYNRSDRPINLQGWTIARLQAVTDAALAKTYPISHQPLWLGVGEYLVLARDASILQSQFASLAAERVHEPPEGIPVLGSQETVVLRDPAGQEQDRVPYRATWGGGNGRSLERINLAGISADSTTWGTSADPLGGTPGRQNSLFTQGLPERVVLSITPNPFSPDGDNHADATVIAYELPMVRAIVSLRIYDTQGRLIRTLIDQQETGSHYQTRWDGRDRAQRKTRIGIYIVYLRVIDAAAGRLETVKRSVVVAGKL